jgi:hypothetical protein
MEKIEFRLTDDEVKHTYLLIPKGKEKLFTRKEDFTVINGQDKFTAYLYFKELHQMGSNLKGGQYRIEFRDPKPGFFDYRKTIVLTNEDGESWKAEIV